MGVFLYLAMPINNIQFRAEIGNFNNAIQCAVSKMTQVSVASLFNNVYKEINEIGHFPTIAYSYTLIHLFSLLLFLSMAPFVILFTLIFSDVSNLYRFSVAFYFCIYIILRFIFNLLWFTIVYRTALTRLLNYCLLRYIFLFQICIFVPYIRLGLIISGDIETNPGPNNLDDQNLTICHWNLNGLAANNYVKISLLEAYNTVHNFDIICITETFLDSDNSSDDQRLSLEGYIMIRSDHPSNTKRGGVCIFYKENLPFVRRIDIGYLDECIVGEIKVKNSKCFVTCVYRSPSQTPDEIDHYLSCFEQVCSSLASESPFCSVIIGDLNAKCTNWWNRGTNNHCGLELYNISTLLGYSQLINEPTNFEPNKTPTCIDLIFASQPNLVIESGVHPSLYNTCHHQIIYAKICFKVHRPPSYKREVWHYNRAQVDLIKRSIDNFDWDRAFLNLSLNDQVEFFSNTLINMFRNFIPHELIKCNSKDPPWMNKEIKSALQKKTGHIENTFQVVESMTMKLTCEKPRILSQT